MVLACFKVSLGIAFLLYGMRAKREVGIYHTLMRPTVSVEDESAWGTPEDFGRLIREGHETMAKLAKLAGIEPERLSEVGRRKEESEPAVVVRQRPIADARVFSPQQTIKPPP
jgi:hypothetical protein